MARATVTSSNPIAVQISGTNHNIEKYGMFRQAKL